MAIICSEPLIGQNTGRYFLVPQQIAIFAAFEDIQTRVLMITNGRGIPLHCCATALLHKNSKIQTILLIFQSLTVPFSNFSTPLGHTAEHTPQPTQLARTISSPRCA